MSSLCDLIALILFSTVLLFGKEAKFSCLGLFRSTTDEAPFGVVLVRLIGVDSSSLSLGFVILLGLGRSSMLCTLYLLLAHLVMVVTSLC